MFSCICPLVFNICEFLFHSYFVFVFLGWTSKVCLWCTWRAILVQFIQMSKIFLNNVIFGLNALRNELTHSQSSERYVPWFSLAFGGGAIENVSVEAFHISGNSIRVLFWIVELHRHHKAPMLNASDQISQSRICRRVTERGKKQGDWRHNCLWVKAKEACFASSPFSLHASSGSHVR